MELFHVLFGVLVLTALIEMLLSVRWNRTYFTAGLPIFVGRVPRPGGIADVSLEELADKTKTALGAAMLYRRLDPDVIAFREQVAGARLHYTPIMHGVIRYDAVEGVARVTGLVNWFAPVFLLTLVVAVRDDATFLLFLAGMFGLLYLLQAARYRRVAKALAAQTAQVHPRG